MTYDVSGTDFSCALTGNTNLKDVLRDFEDSGDVQTTTLGAAVRFVSFLFDTGANVTVLMTELNDMLVDAVRSLLSVNGFHDGSGVDGDQHGTLHLFVLGQEVCLPGSSISEIADSIPGTRHNLFSFREAYDTGEYNCNFRQPGQGFSGLFKGTDEEKTDLIPFRYNKETGQWFIDAVISVDPARAKQVGEAIQQKLMRKQMVSPEVEASLCVENTRYCLADIIEQKQVAITFCDDDYDEFIPAGEINGAVEHIRSKPDNTLFEIDTTLCNAIIEATGSQPVIRQEEVNELLGIVFSSNGDRRVPLSQETPYYLACPTLGSKPDESGRVPEKLVFYPDWSGRESRRVALEVIGGMPRLPDKGVPAKRGNLGENGLKGELQQEDDVERNDPTMKGIKQNLSSRFIKMSNKDFHDSMAHLGGLADCPECEVCRQAKKTLRRVFKKETPAMDPRVGYEWHMDTMTMEVDSVQGCKYANIFYQKNSKVIFAVYLAKRSDALETTEELIRMVREHPDFQGHEHQLFSELHVDQAGEFGGDPAFLKMLKRNNCKHVPKDQIDKRDNAAAEYIIGLIQRRLRTLMIDTNLPPTYWQYAMTNLIDLLNVVARHEDIVSKFSDSPRPLEILSRGRIDRTECNSRLRWYVKTGTPAIVSRVKSKGGKKHLNGGNITTMTRSVWAVALNQVGNMTLFETIAGGDLIMTKSYVVFSLTPGQNAWHFCGAIPPALSQASMKRRSRENDFPTQQVVQLPATFGDPMEQNEVLGGVTMMGTGGEEQPRVIVLDNDGRVVKATGPEGEFVTTTETVKLPELKARIDQLSDNENEVSSIAFLLERLKREPKSFVGTRVWQHFQDTTPAGVYQGQVQSHQEFGELKTNIFYVAFPATESCPCHLTEYDDGDIIKFAIEHRDGTVPVECPMDLESLHVNDFEQYTTSETETFFKVCHNMGIAQNEWKRYYHWICENFEYGEGARSVDSSLFFTNPFERSDRAIRRNRLPEGTVFPYPTGDSWLETKLRREREAELANREFIDSQEKRMAMEVISEKIRIDEKDVGNGRMGVRKLLISMTGNESDPRLETLNEMDFEDPGVTTELLNVMSAKYDDANLALKPLSYLGRSVDPSSSKRQQKLAGQVVRNDSEITDADLEGYKFIMLDKSHFKNETPEERKAELAGLMKKYVESGICDEYKDESGRISAPQNVKEARARKDAPLWEFALKVELTAFRKKHVHSAQVNLHQMREDGIHQSPVPSHIIFEFKFEEGKNTKPKARWVLAGTPHNMKALEHYFQSFAPAADSDSTRLLQAIAVGRGLKRAKADVETAFLNSLVPKRERVPVMMPLGMEQYDDSGRKLGLVLLLRGQYGSPSAAYLWYMTLREFTLRVFNQAKWSCKNMKQEPCMFRITDPNGTRLWILWHVDDGDIVSECAEMTAYVLKIYNGEFGITVSDPDYMLGLRRDVTTERGEDGKVVMYNTLTQGAYLEGVYVRWEKLCEEAGRPMSKKVPTYPMNTIKKYSVVGTESVPKPSEAETKATLDMFQSGLGEVNWASRHSKWECTYSTSVNGRMMSVAGEAALESLTQEIQYMFETREQGIRYRSDGHDQLTAKYDAAFDPDAKDGKSMGGYLIKLFGGVISWSAKKERNVAVSSTHSEYQTQAAVTKTVVHLRQLLFEMGLEEHCKNSTVIEGDNQQAVTLGLEPKVTEGNKFYVLDLHFCKDMFEEGHVQYRWTPGENNHADIMTKALGTVLFDRFVKSSSGYSKSPVEVLAPPLLGRAEEGNFPGWDSVRHQLDHPGMTREQLIYMDHLTEQDSAKELSMPVTEMWNNPAKKV